MPQFYEATEPEMLIPAKWWASIYLEVLDRIGLVIDTTLPAIIMICLIPVIMSPDV